MKIIDNTPIENFDTDWGDPDGTGMKEKSLEQVQKFIKGSIKRIEEDAADLKKDNESFKKNVDNQIANQSNEIAVFKKDVTNQIENYKPIEINGNVNNAADEEDLTAENGLIKIANRGTLYGKGYKILRRGVDLQSQLNQENTIYEIRYNFDLNGKTIDIPKGCSLVFSGGSFDNGCLLGNNTSIVAGAYKIFGDGLVLHKYCFSYKVDNVETNIELKWLNIKQRMVRYETTSDKRKWILSNDSGIRCSNFEGNCHFKKQGSNIDINVDSDFLLNACPGKFSEINKNTGNIIENNLNTLDVLKLSYYKNGNILTIPHKSKWVFFYSNNIEDDLNLTYIQPGTEIDLSAETIYCTSLNRAFIHPEASTWCNEAKLEWFIGDGFYKSFVEFNNSPIISDQSYNIQRALDASMDIISHIRGIIPVENTLYAEVRKKIYLGSRYNLTDEDAFVSNAQYKVKYSVPSTVILGLADKDLFMQRTTVVFYGGLLTTYYAAIHKKNLWVVDMDYKTSYSEVNTSLLGKKPDNSGYYTNAAFTIAQKNGNGYTSFSKYDIYTKFTKYGIFAEQANTASYINSSEINAYIFGYYEGVHIENSFGASIMNITLQAVDSLPLNEVDYYRNAYIKTSRSTINIINWDFSSVKDKNKIIQKPYKKILIEGDNAIVGTSSLYTAQGASIENYRDRIGSKNKNFTVTSTANTPLHLPLLENVFAGIKHSQIKKCHFIKITCKEDVDVSILNEKIENDDTRFTIESVTTSTYNMENLFSVKAGLLPAVSLTPEQFVEAYVELKDGYTLNKKEKFRQCAFDFATSKNIFTYAKIIMIGSSKTYVKDIEMHHGQTFAIFDMGEVLNDIKSCIVRLYGEKIHNYGIGANIESINCMPQLRGLSLHESCNYFNRNFQPISYGPSSLRPIDDVMLGQSYYDSTLKKPLWWNGTAWVDANGEVVSGTSI